MNDWINSSQFWDSSIVSGLVGMTLTFLLARPKGPAYSLLSGAKGRFKEFARGRRYKALRAAKAIRFDSAQISRKVALNYCLLGLFIVSIGAIPASLAFAPPVIHQDKLASMLYMSFTGIPMLILEFAWLNASSNVTLLLERRGKIKRRGGRMI